MAACSLQAAGQLWLEHRIDGPVDDGVIAEFAGQPAGERRDLGAVQPQGWVGGQQPVVHVYRPFQAQLPQPIAQQASAGVE